MSELTTSISKFSTATMTNRLTQSKSNLADVIKKLESTSVDKNEKLEAGIIYLLTVKAVDLNNDANQYMIISKEIMTLLNKAFKGEEHYKPWVRYFNVAQKVVGDYDDDAFTAAMDKLIEEVLLPSLGGNIDAIDWRIVKKLLSAKELFENNQLLLVSPKSLLKSLKARLNEALDYLVWKEQSECVIITRKTINTLLIAMDDENQSKNFENGIISGRFDKEHFGLEDTVILGEDGGMYLLLNRIKDSKRKILEDEFGKEYLQDKIKGSSKSNDSKTGDRIEIGKGSFGIVRFALNLLEDKASPGDIICVKKSRSYKVIRQKSDNFILSAIDIITDSTIEDYFTSNIAKVVYAPKIYDMAIVINKNLIDNSSHQKGYLMMEVLPQNTGGNIFKLPEYQKWEYQKPYLMDIFEGIRSLLERNVAMTDLKPDNTLYDKDLRKAVIIDLGGTVKVESQELLKNFTIEKYSVQSTPAFTAPELQANQGVIDLSKAISYSCGKVASSISSSTDYNDVDGKLKRLIKSLTEEDPTKRLDLEEAISILSYIGDDIYKQKIIFSNYVSKVKERIKNNRSSISLNEDIFRIQDSYIKQEVTTLDPYKYKNMKSEDLKKKVDEFFKDEKGKEVFLLLGLAGSGKSVLLQLKFIEAMNNWKSGEPLPIYFNLANGIELQDILSKLNHELKTDLSLNKSLKNERVHLYIDSFDEGIGSRLEMRDKLLQSYIEQLGSNPFNKMLVSCRSDYLQTDNDDIWFIPKSKDGSSELNKMEKFYIAPIDYTAEENLRGDIERYINSKILIEGAKNNNYTVKDYLDKIKLSNLKGYIDTGYMFYMMMEVLPSLKETNINRFTIYRHYAQNYHATKISMLMKERQEKIEKNFSSSATTGFYDKIAKYIASELHIHNKARISEESPIFKMLSYNQRRVFRYQLASHLLEILPLKLEIKEAAETKDDSKPKESITIGFKHDTLRKYYFIEAVRDELAREGFSKILASHTIVTDVQLIKLMGEAIMQDQSDLWQKCLLEAVNNSKTNKSAASITSATNAITLLVSIKYVFSCDDLAGISIKGANLQNGIFEYTDFTGADLSGVNFTNSKLTAVNFRDAIMTDVNLSIFPDLLGHEDSITGVTYSPDSKTIATSSKDKTIKIWHATNGSKLFDLRGHTGVVSSVTYSPDGRAIASGSDDKTIKIWNASTGGKVADLRGHTDAITRITYSPDGKTIATGSNDKTVRIWDVVTGEKLSDLQGPSDTVCSVAYSPDGKTVATGSGDGGVKIWNANTGNILLDLRGHTQTVSSVIYSSDGKSIAAGSADMTLKIWDVATGNKLFDIKEHTGVIYSVAYSPDGKTIASASADKTVKIWDVATCSKVTDLNGHTDNVVSVTYSPNGRTIATGSKDKTIKIWDVSTGKKVADLLEHTDAVLSVTYSPNGKTIASGSADNTVKIWNAQTYKKLSDLNGHTTFVKSVAYSPNGKTIVTGSGDKIVRIWDLVKGNKVLELHGHTNWVYSVTYSPDGKKIATGSLDKTVKIWNAATGKKLLDMQGHNNGVKSITYSPDGKTIVTSSCDHISKSSCDHIVKIWNASTGINFLNLQGHNDAICSVAYSSDGKTIATGSDDKTVKIWNSTTGSILLNLDGNGKSISNIAYSPDSKTIAVGSGIVWDVTTGIKLLNLDQRYINIGVTYSSDGKIIATASKTAVELWDAVTGNKLASLLGHSSKITTFAYSPNGKTVAIGSEDKTIKVWDTAFNDQLSDVHGHRSGVQSIAYSPDGKTIASSSEDSTVKIWNVATGIEVLDLKGHTLCVYSVAYSPDGKTIASASRDKTVKIWDSTTGIKLLDIKGHSDWVKSVAYSPDGKTIVTTSGDKTVKIWSTATGRNLFNIEGHTSPVDSATYSPDGKLIATASRDKTAKLWDASTYKNLLDLRGHTQFLTSIVYSPDGKFVATASCDKLVKIWDATTGQKLKDLRGHTSNVLSVAYSPDGKTIATGSLDNSIKIWDADTGRKLSDIYGHKDAVSSVTYSPNGKTIATGSDDKTIKIWAEKNSRWIAIKEFSAFTNPLFANQMIIDGAINLSSLNERIFKQRGCQVGQIKTQKTVENREEFNVELQEFNNKAIKDLYTIFKTEHTVTKPDSKLVKSDKEIETKQEGKSSPEEKAINMHELVDLNKEKTNIEESNEKVILNQKRLAEEDPEADYGSGSNNHNDILKSDDKRLKGDELNAQLIGSSKLIL